MAKPKVKSRPQRWADAAARAVTALADLKEIQQEYQDWRDNLPENLADSALANKLDEVVGIDLESAEEAAQEAETVELPLGFGRD